MLLDVVLDILLYYSHNLNQVLEKLDRPQSSFQSRRISHTPFRKKMRLQWIWCERKIWVFNFFKMQILFISKHIRWLIFEYGTLKPISWINIYIMKNIFFLLVGMSLAVVKERRKRTYMKCFLQQLPYDIALPELFDTVRNSRNINYVRVSDVLFLLGLSILLLDAMQFWIVWNTKFHVFKFIPKGVILYQILCSVCK